MGEGEWFSCVLAYLYTKSELSQTWGIVFSAWGPVLMKNSSLVSLTYTGLTSCYVFTKLICFWSCIIVTIKLTLLWQVLRSAILPLNLLDFYRVCCKNSKLGNKNSFITMSLLVFLESQLISLFNLDTSWMTKVNNVQPLLVRIMYKTRLRYYGNTETKVDVPYQVGNLLFCCQGLNRRRFKVFCCFSSSIWCPHCNIDV